jgi:hypothetical protein
MCFFQAESFLCPCPSATCPKKMQEINGRPFVDAEYFAHLTEYKNQESFACAAWREANAGDARGSRSCRNTIFKAPNTFDRRTKRTMEAGECLYCREHCLGELQLRVKL